MKLDFISKEVHYEGCPASFEDASIILVGAGFDGTSSYRSGSRNAPSAIRKDTLYSQENYSPYFGRDITEKAIHDFGDIEIVGRNKKLALERIQQTASYIFKHKKKPVVIGGEHLITLPCIQAALNFYPDLHIIQVDAHLDLLDELFGHKLSHGTVFRRVYDLLNEDMRICQVGIRSGSREEYEFAQKHTRMFPFRVDNFITELSNLKGYPVYLSLDLDVFDPSLIPGTGTPEAGGIMFDDYINLLKTIQDLNIIGCDVVELCPDIDPTGTSTIVAGKIIRELLLIL